MDAEEGYGLKGPSPTSGDSTMVVLRAHTVRGYKRSSCVRDCGPPQKGCILFGQLTSLCCWWAFVMLGADILSCAACKLRSKHTPSWYILKGFPLYYSTTTWAETQRQHIVWLMKHQGYLGLDTQRLETEFCSPEFACHVQGPGLALKHRE